MHGIDRALMVLCDIELGQMDRAIADAVADQVINEHAAGAECAKTDVALMRLAGEVGLG